MTVKLVEADPSTAEDGPVKVYEVAGMINLPYFTFLALVAVVLLDLLASHPEVHPFHPPSGLVPCSGPSEEQAALEVVFVYRL